MRGFLYCLIFPHSSNNHRAKILHPKILFITVIFFLATSLFSSRIIPVNGFRTYADISVQELVNLTNQKRKDNGLSPLSSNSNLTLAASRKVDDMFAKNYWAHNSPDGVTPWVFIKGSGYSYIYAGENLARGFNSANDVINAWMASKDHRENLLSPNFKDVGFAVKSGKLGGENTFLVVQELGSRTYAVVPLKSKPIALSGKKVLGFNFSPPFINRPTLTLSSDLAITIMFGFITILMLDMFIIERKKVFRFVGHNLDHAVFLFLIIVIIIAFNTGAVI